MIEVCNHFSLDSGWFIEASKRIGARLIDNRIAVLPESLGQGEFYFTEVLPGISILLMDVVFTTEVLYRRIKSEDDLYILQFDISDEVNDVVVDNDDTNESRVINSGFSVMNNQIENSFKPMIGERIFALRLLVDKNLLNGSIKKACKVDISEENTIGCQVKGCSERACEGDKESRVNCIDAKYLMYDNMESKSKVLIHSIKKKSVFDADFDLFIKGIALKLLVNFIDNYIMDTFGEIAQNDIDAILKTKKYLSNNLHNSFPGISFLAKLSRMSDSKYKDLFKEVCGTTANQFFMSEKIKFAQKLLKSKEFCSIGEVAAMLNYPRCDYFSAKYLEFFGRTPSKDFVRKLCTSSN